MSDGDDDKMDIYDVESFPPGDPKADRILIKTFGGGPEGGYVVDKETGKILDYVSRNWSEKYSSTGADIKHQRLIFWRWKDGKLGDELEPVDIGVLKIGMAVHPFYQCEVILDVRA